MKTKYLFIPAVILFASLIVSKVAFSVPANTQTTITSAIQDLSGTITPSGFTITSLATGKEGSFSLVPKTLSRTDGTVTAFQSFGTISSQTNAVTLDQGALAQEFKTSENGIEQSFIIPSAPSGKGNISLSLKTTGVSVASASQGVKLTLSSGRILVYDHLLVTDAHGKHLPSLLVASSDNTILITVDDASATYPITIDPTITDANWQPNFGQGGTNPSGIYASLLYATSTNTLYVGGGFNTVGGTSGIYGFASWNGSSWSTLGLALNSSSLVRAFAYATSTNTLYAGGFLNNGYANIVSWNGSSWSTVGGGISGGGGIGQGDGPYALALDQSGNLYAGGKFGTAGVTSVADIAEWNGSSWSALGTGVSGGQITALAYATSTNTLYVGGYFTTAGGSGANKIASWNGSTWSTLGTGMNGAVDALTLSPSGTLYAGGSFSTAGGTSVNNIASWNGSSWSALGSGVGVGGTDTVYALAYATSTNTLYVGGSFTTAGGSGANNIASWNGSTWSAIGSGITGYNSSYQTGPTNVSAFTFDPLGNLYVAGIFNTDGTASSSNIAELELNDSLTYSAGANGTLSGTPYQVVSYGGNGTSVTATPSAYYSFANWSDGSTSATRIDTNVTANASYTANFSPIPPVISLIASSTSETTATITWTTDKLSTSTVNYGLTSGYGTASSSSAITFSHSITLSSLSPSTTYHFQVSSGTSTNAYATSSDQTFTTLATPASTYTFTGPSSADVNTTSTNFIVTPVGGQYTGTITITPTAGFGLSPIVLTFASSSAAQTFTITPTTAGTITLTPTNNGSLTDSSALIYIANTPVTVSTGGRTYGQGGGGGGGGSIISVPVSTVQTTQTTTASQNYSFTSARNLGLRSAGTDVLALQKFLNSHNFLVASTGAGSPGNETSFFGFLTQAAVEKFQLYYHIVANASSQGYGSVGQLTKVAIIILEAEGK